MTEQKKQVDQNRILGANYITEFFLEIKSLTEQYANYKNIYLEMEYKLEDSESKIDPDQLNNAKTAVYNIKFISNKVYVHFCTLRKVLELPEEICKPIIDSYNTFNTSQNTLPKVSDIENFVIEVNTILTRDIISNLLQTSQDILNELYNK